MGKNCCGPVEDVEANNDPLWRRILWIALILNAVMFSVEIVAGLAADSRALQADALDFLCSCCGHDHVVLGSDYPFPIGDMKPLEIIENADLNEEQKHAILGNTAAELFSIT